MIEWVRDLVVRPGAAFGAVEDRPSLAGAVAVPLALGVTGVVELGLAVGAVDQFADELGGPLLRLAVGRSSAAAPGSLVLLGVVALLAPVLGWLVTAGVAYAVSKLFDPTPDLRRFLALVGWGHVPLLVPAVAAVAHLTVVVARAPPLPTRAAAETWAQTAIVSSPVRTAIEVVGPVFALWAAALWMLAAEEALDLSRRRAVVCVALPGLLTLLDSVGGAVTVVAP